VIAGLRRWMNAVAMMTPEPKYFANSKTLWGIATKLERRAMMGKVAPKVLQVQIMKTDAMRRPV
jgi:hypothetical protein